MDELKYSGDLPTDVRREQILGFIESHDFVRVSDLSTRFRVSEVTIRGDLEVLAERGQVRRIRGGARPRALPRPERSFEEMQKKYSSKNIFFLFVYIAEAHAKDEWPVGKNKSSYQISFFSIQF